MGKKTKDNKNKFQGRIIRSNNNFHTPKSDVQGLHQIWYPESATDASHAIELLQDKNIFIRSGIQVSKQDRIDGKGGVVINLSELKNVIIVGNKVKVEAGVNAELLAKKLIEHQLVLPITDNSYKSITSNLIRETPSYLIRSLGLLSDYVISIEAVSPAGVPVSFSPEEGASAISQYKETESIITAIEFEAASTENLWLVQKTCPYPDEETFLKLSKKLFLDFEPLQQVDLVLEAYNGLYEIPVLRLRAFGTRTEDLEKVEGLIETILKDASIDATDLLGELTFGTDVLKEIIASETGTSFDPTIDSERIHTLQAIEEEAATFLTQHARLVHNGIVGDGKRHKKEYLVSRIQLNQSNQLEVTAYHYTYSVSDDDLMDIDTSFDIPALDFLLPPTATRDVIPNFKGDIYRAKELGYDACRKQYATSSKSKSEMAPFMIAYPDDADDVAAVILFAKHKNKKLVARSGGHQYSGKSSGGQDTIVLSMDNFKTISINDKTADVGPAVKLASLAKSFKEAGITIPHGECPHVAIGGHAQTGGYGHLLRNFGLTLDYVQSFDIVLADGSQHTVTRPKTGEIARTNEEKFNQELFWGVLGGNAGSFGIITNYTFETIKDEDYPNAYGWSMTRKFRENIFLKMMKEVQQWTVGVEDGTLPAELDLMMTVASAGRSPLPLLLVEFVHSNFKKEEGIGAGKDIVESMIETASSGLKWWEKRLVEDENKPLSELSDSFVRHWPATSQDGREFTHPYKKRVNCTLNALTDDFITAFAAIISRVVEDTPGVKLIFQMLIGGGAYQKKGGKDNSLPHRDYTYCFVFDLFYKDGHEATAEALQQDMQNIIDAHFSPEQELRVFWGSFGKTDINDPKIRQMYYNDEAKYARLQALKKEVDPMDVFHTNLTVQLPTEQDDDLLV